jgi:hypothetical protein
MVNVVMDLIKHLTTQLQDPLWNPLTSKADLGMGFWHGYGTQEGNGSGNNRMQNGYLGEGVGVDIHLIRMHGDGVGEQYDPTDI